MLVDKCQQVALRHKGIAQVQLVELCLARSLVDIQLIEFRQIALRLGIGQRAQPLLHPANEQVVQGSVLHKLQRAERVGDTLQVVALAVGEVVHGIGVPL